MCEVFRVSSSNGPWEIECRADGSLLVYVHSSDVDGTPLPDAVFTFVPGDPQYGRWVEEFQRQLGRDNCTDYLLPPNELHDKGTG
jgi:hypothetical protein